MRSLTWNIAALMLGLAASTSLLPAQYLPPEQQQQQPDQQQGYPPQDPGNYGQGQPQSDPSTLNSLDSDRQHAVARLSVTEGEANIVRGDIGTPVAAAVNAPLMSRDRLQTSGTSRAEIELDAGTVVRVGASSDLVLADLTQQQNRFQLGAGTLILRIANGAQIPVEVDTPDLGVKPTQLGEYRITVNGDGSTQVSVRSGEAEIDSNRGSQTLSAGYGLIAKGSGNNSYFNTTGVAPLDELDSWSQQRDGQVLSARSYQYMDPAISGGSDLDANGQWVQSQYGQAWEPRGVSPDWSPYSDGSWAYEPYYGWTWVDSASWGWAPYHYGRWFMNPGFGWCWWPGGRHLGVSWSPALVGFFGFGGGLGWVPLAPYESCRPWWGRGFGISIGFGFGGGYGFGRGGIWGSYRNAGYRGGAIVAGFDRFGSRGGRFGFASRAQLSGASFVNGRLPVSPSRASYAFSNRSAYSNIRPAATANRAFFHGGAASNYARSGVSGFASGGSGTGRFGSAGSGSFRGGFGQQTGFRSPSGAGAPAANNSGWHSFGNASRAEGFQAGPQQQQSSGWHNFGQSQHGVVPQHGYSGQGFSQPATSSYGGSYGSSYGSGGSAYRGYSSQPAANSSRFNGASSYSRPAAGYGQQHFSQPSFSQPRAEQPHYQSSGGYSRPSGSGGGHSSGGGGGSHSGGSGGHSSGGGGGGHSGGGGGHHR